MPVGKTKDAGWEIGVSRTLPVPIDTAWSFLTSPEGVRLWLGDGATVPTVKGQPIVTADGGAGELRSVRDLDRIRLRWQPAGWSHATIVQIAIRGDATKTMIRFHQDHLADANERAEQHTHWTAVMDAIEGELAPPA